MKKHNNVKCSQEEKISSLLGEHVSKKSEDEERSDKSSLTDEHDEPVCYLSDGTQNSSKRKRQPSQSIAASTTTSITVESEFLISHVCKALLGLPLSDRFPYINYKML